MPNLELVLKPNTYIFITVCNLLFYVCCYSGSILVWGDTQLAEFPHCVVAKPLQYMQFITHHTWYMIIKQTDGYCAINIFSSQQELKSCTSMQTVSVTSTTLVLHQFCWINLHPLQLIERNQQQFILLHLVLIKLLMESLRDSYWALLNV